LVAIDSSTVLEQENWLPSYCRIW